MKLGQRYRGGMCYEEQGDIKHEEGLVKEVLGGGEWGKGFEIKVVAPG